MHTLVNILYLVIIGAGAIGGLLTVLSVVAWVLVELAHWVDRNI